VITHKLLLTSSFFLKLEYQNIKYLIIFSIIIYLFLFNLTNSLKNLTKYFNSKIETI